jgi:hypothetical protein
MHVAPYVCTQLLDGFRFNLVKPVGYKPESRGFETR